MAVTGWFLNRWTQPYYYSYGSGGSVVYENNIVYVDGQEQCTATEYYDQATEIAAAVPEYTEPQAEEQEWLPLGVFALTREGVNATNMVIQLAVNRDGVIAGTLFNEQTEKSQALQGSVDLETQRFAVASADDSNQGKILEGGIYDLTEDTSTVLLHYGAEKTQDMVLVRLQEDEAAAATES